MPRTIEVGLTTELQRRRRREEAERRRKARVPIEDLFEGLEAEKRSQRVAGRKTKAEEANFQRRVEESRRVEQERSRLDQQRESGRADAAAKAVLAGLKKQREKEAGIGGRAESREAGIAGRHATDVEQKEIGRAARDARARDTLLRKQEQKREEQVRKRRIEELKEGSQHWKDFVKEADDKGFEVFPVDSDADVTTALFSVPGALTSVADDPVQAMQENARRVDSWGIEVKTHPETGSRYILRPKKASFIQGLPGQAELVFQRAMDKANRMAGQRGDIRDVQFPLAPPPGQASVLPAPSTPAPLGVAPGGAPAPGPGLGVGGGGVVPPGGGVAGVAGPQPAGQVGSLPGYERGVNVGTPYPEAYQRGVDVGTQYPEAYSRGQPVPPGTGFPGPQAPAQVDPLQSLSPEEQARFSTWPPDKQARFLQWLQERNAGLR